MPNDADADGRNADELEDNSTRSERPDADAPVTVVGIGASAGGLEALLDLLSGLSPIPAMAFVLVQHLDPTHKSDLAEILGRSTTMPVAEATDGAQLESGHMYVIPPDQALTVFHGAIQTSARPARKQQHLAIDHFLLSLAEEGRDRAIAVILSGAGSDGAAGLRAVKGAGGIVFAQDPRLAKYDSMPKMAIATGQVDLVLSAADIGRELARIGTHPHVSRSTVPTRDGSSERL